MRNAGLEEAQTGIKIAGRNINNLRYADNTMLMAESEGELERFLLRVKEESEKADLKLNIQKLRYGICSHSQQTGSKWKKSTSRLYIVSLLI